MAMETILIIAAFAAITSTLLVGSMGFAVYGRAKEQSRAYRQERSITEASVKARRVARRRAANQKPAPRKPAIAARAAADASRHAAM
ncbi:hypothetical protein M8R20_21645 [Pseudomonas sp. R2.Fl]|nr:hypothetical protein [Pseudomonas sp. R2.Fl]